MHRSFGACGAILIPLASTPVPPSARSAAVTSSWELFRADQSSLMSCTAPQAPGVSRGYAANVSANLSFDSSFGKPDAKATFTVGTNPYSDRSAQPDFSNCATALPTDDSCCHRHFQAQLPSCSQDEYFQAEEATGRFFAPNLWPSEMPLQRAWQPYIEAMHQITDCLTAAMERSLQLSPGTLHGRSTGRSGTHFSELRAVYYPASDVSMPSDPVCAGQHRISPHKDFSLFTILLSGVTTTQKAARHDAHLWLASREGSNTHATEAVQRKDLWCPLVCPDQHLLVILGEPMQRWTNDVW